MLSRILTSRTTLILALLLVAMGAIVVGLMDTPRLRLAMTMAELFITALVALLVGWLFGKKKLPVWWFLPMGVASGIVWGFLFKGEIYRPLLNCFRKLPVLFPRLALWNDIKPNWQPMITALQLLIDETIRVYVRISYWYDGVIQGERSSDLLPMAIFWLIVIWLLAAWAGWATLHFHNPLLGLTPAVTVLAILVNYQGLNAYTLLVPLASTMLLMTLTRYDYCEQEWVENRIDFAEGMQLDLMVTVAIICVAILSLATVVSSFSIQAVVTFIQRFTQPVNGVDPMVEALGLEQKRPDVQENLLLHNNLIRYHRLGTAPDLTQDVVMFIQVTEPEYRYQAFLPPNLAPSVPRYYWRSSTFDTYLDSSWYSDRTWNVSYSAEDAIFTELPGRQQIVRQIITAKRELGSVLFVTGQLLSVDEAYEVAWRRLPGKDIQTPNDLNAADSLGALIAAERYQAVSFLVDASAAELRASSSNYPDWAIQHYLQLPDELPFRVRELAVEITDQADNPYDKALAIERFLRSIPYSLKIPEPPSGQDGVDYFLFNLQAGFCDYYASAMAVLARAAGLPARFVMGYASGIYDPNNDHYVVVEANAHAWVEIYFNDIGWVAFEPTAAQPAIIRPDDESQQDEVVATLPTNEDTQTLSWAIRLRKVVPLIFIGLVVSVVLVVQVMFVWRALDALWWKHLHPQDAIKNMYQRMCRDGEYVIGQHPIGDTPYEYTARLQSVIQDSILRQSGRTRLPGFKKVPSLLIPASREIQQITELYVYSVYSAQLATPEMRAKVLDTWQRLRGRLWLARILSLRGR